jgi:hypothetical protein
MALMNVCLQSDQQLDVWCGHAGCSEHFRYAVLHVLVWYSHTARHAARHLVQSKHGLGT